MRLLVVGSGYVGLVSGASFAELGNDVICVDSNMARIDDLNHGRLPIYEPGLDALVIRNVAARRLAFATTLAPLVADADAVFIAVGTPQGRDGQADLSAVFAVAREIAAAAADRIIVVTKSTVPVGTGAEIERIIRTARPDLELAVVSNPEFLREGSALTDFMRPDRVVIGTDDSRARAVLAELYRPIEAAGFPVVFTSRDTAEIIKYAANAFLATKITFINEMADLCEAVGADVAEVAQGIGLDRRIGGAFLQAGPGYGGSCFPKDTHALFATAQDHDVRLHIVESTIAANERRKRAMARRVIRAMGGSAHGKTVAVLGLTFKADTDDMREAPSIALITALQAAGARIRAHDPVGMEQARLCFDDVAFLNDPYRCAEGADAAVLVTDWDSLKRLDPERLGAVMRARIFVDLRNALNQAAFARAGFAAHALGRRTVLPRAPHATEIEAETMTRPAALPERHRREAERLSPALTDHPFPAAG